LECGLTTTGHSSILARALLIGDPQFPQLLPCIAGHESLPYAALHLKSQFFCALLQVEVKDGAVLFVAQKSIMGTLQ